METREIERYVRQVTSVSYVDTGDGKHFTLSVVSREL